MEKIFYTVLIFANAILSARNCSPGTQKMIWTIWLKCNCYVYFYVQGKSHSSIQKKPQQNTDDSLVRKVSVLGYVIY